MMEKLCDLHTHSTFSDGDHTPTQLVEAALAKGLGAVALCDHNTVEGLPELLQAARGKEILAIPGGEFTVDYQGKELHLLGLLIPESAFAAIEDKMRPIRRSKEDSNRQLIASLGRVGIRLDYDKLKAATPKGNVNRSAIAAELVRQGVVASKGEAFAGLLSETGEHYRPGLRLSLWEMLETLCSLGAAPVLAHPFKELSEEELVTLLPPAKERGLLGLECRHSDHTADQMRRGEELAAQFGLCPTGGSDFHGAEKEGLALGDGYGNVQTPLRWALQLEQALAQRK